MEARPQEVRCAPHQSSQNGRPAAQNRGRSNRPKTRIQGGWAADLPKRGRPARGRGQPNFRGRGFTPTLQGLDFTQASPSSDHTPQPQGSYPPGLNPYAPEFQIGTTGPPVQEQSQGLQSFETRSQPQDLINMRYTYVQPEEQVIVQQEKKVKMIEEDGEYLISEGPSGESKVKLLNHFLDLKEADKVFHQLQEEIDFKQQINKNRAGMDYEEPRLVHWFGEHPYAYSKVRMEADEGWPPTLQGIKEKIEKETGLTFNSVLANMYRNGKDGVAWHSDDEYGLREQPKIASLSLGETRMFEMRKKPPKGISSYDYDYSDSDKLAVPLTSGALLLMTGHTQDDWQHQVPKEYHDKKMRINLTFRTIYPDPRFDKSKTGSGD